ncbi:hypothetical protein [Leifsonia xyli]|uniref:hypothetical protein n=1 Tax=Leifsonia xyli TaxID=1575 RepID=UPI003D669AF8
MRKSPAVKSARTIGTGCAVLGASLIALGLLGTAPAIADTGSNDPLAAVVEATPVTADNAAPVVTNSTGESAIDATVSDARVVVPTDPTDDISVETEGGTFSVSLPFSADAASASVEKRGIVSYDNNNGTISVPIVTEDGSLQVNTVISDATAPTRYEYGLTIPEGGQIVPAGDAFFIVNAESEPIAVIKALWAKDADGKEVPTHYELDETTLTQVVDLSAASALPVVADPQFAWYGAMPSVKLSRAETKTATTLTGMATVCGWVTRYTSYVGGAICGANAASIIYNSQRICYTEKGCAQLLVAPGVIGTVGYSGGYCK